MEDQNPEKDAPKGGLGILFAAAALGLAALLVTVGIIAYMAMRP